MYNLLPGIRLQTIIMKRSILIILFTHILFLFVNAQNQGKNDDKISIGIAFSTLGKYNVKTPSNRDVEIPKYSSESFYSLGISLFYNLNKIVAIESGIYYSDHLINIDSPYKHPTFFLDEKIELIEIPINFRFEFKYFYISSGLIFDFQVTEDQYIDKQGGIGVNTGLGINYHFKSGISVYAGPIGYIHSAVSLDKHRLMGISPQIGVKYQLK